MEVNSLEEKDACSVNVTVTGGGEEGLGCGVALSSNLGTPRWGEAFDLTSKGSKYST